MNSLAVSIVVILFPGIIAAIIADKIAVHSKPWGSFKYSIYSFVFGAWCYFALQVAFWVVCGLHRLKNPGQPWIDLDLWSMISATKPRVEVREVLLACFASPLVAVIAALAINRKLLTKYARRLNISSKYGDENLFSFYLNSKEVDWVYLRDPENGLTYEGRVVSYCENDVMQEIVLSDVRVYSYEDSTLLYEVPSVYLAKPVATFVIESVPSQYLEKTNGKEEDQRGGDATAGEGGRDKAPAGNSSAAKPTAPRTKEKVARRK